MSEYAHEARLAGVVMAGTRHACALFRSPEEEYAVMLPFVKEGLDHAEKALHIVDPSRRPELLRRLGETGVDTDALQETGQLEVRDWSQAHTQGGRFDQEAWLYLLEQTLAGYRAQGYSQTRLWSNQEWALEDLQGTEDLIEYECRFVRAQTRGESRP